VKMSLLRTTVCAVLSGISMVAAPAVNLDEFDSNAMRAMDDAFKDLEPVLGASNTAAAKENLATLQEVYKWTLEYFTAQEKEGREGIVILKAGSKLLGEIDAALNKRDFNGAIAKARELQANCKSCHDKFKPKKQ
jgi:cytochrome c556